MDQTNSMFLLIIAFAGVIVLFIFLYFVPVGLWITALFSNVRVGLLELVGMRFRKVPPGVIVNSLITATKAGLELTTSDLETHYLAGGNVPTVIRALISADKANINLSFKQATAIDLAGRDVFEAVQISVNPKVINTPNVAAVAADGIQLIAKARVTVRANIAQLVGGAGEETILARVGEGIVTSIGSAATHKSVLERRAMAVALEQEMKAKNVEMRAKVIEAEAEVPRALAEAFRNGTLGVMDYYRMENIKSDTSMRESIATSEETKDSGSGKSDKK
jgi:uncharacterized protein YqfA (UPF0365 family)